jgi:hypothetical protein
MEIHPPHPIRSMRDFLLQIFTITCGIIIALILEGVLDTYRHGQLRQRAAADFSQELAANRTRMEQFVRDAAADQAQLRTIIGYGTARLNHEPTALPVLHGRSFVTMGDYAWQNALATQAIDQFDFDTAHALATVYDKQAVFNTMETKARDQWFNISGYGPPQDVPDDQVRSAVHEARIALTYQQSLVPFAEEMVTAYTAAARALQPAH